jgi:hypothetical protein
VEDATEYVSQQVGDAQRSLEETRAHAQQSLEQYQQVTRWVFSNGVQSCQSCPHRKLLSSRVKGFGMRRQACGGADFPCSALHVDAGAHGAL